MTKIDEASAQELFAEIHRRLKNEITNEELTYEFWDYMNPTQKELEDKGRDIDLYLMTDDEIQDEVKGEIPNTEIFKFITRMAYLNNTATIREWNELQAEARQHLKDVYNQHHGFTL